MSKPKWSVGQSLSRLGRLENACATALAEADTPRALDQLRLLQPRFEALGQACAPLWPRYVESVCDARFHPHLEAADFDRLCAFDDHLAAADAAEWPRSRWPIVQACVARGAAADLQRAYRLLVKLYRAPWAQDEHRLGAASWLADLGAMDDPHLAVYADVMIRWPRPPVGVAARVAAVMDVGFDSDAERLRRACSLAVQLGGPTASADNAYVLGLGELLVRGRPASAVPLFAAALARTGDHAEALRGLLSARLRTREFSAAVAAGRAAIARTPRCADLLLLCETLGWLDGDGASGAPPETSADRPTTAARLAEIVPGPDTGPWRDYALGRAYLIEGDAQQARQLLLGVLEAGLWNADVHYHCAWADLLCHEPAGVRERYNARARISGGWALGCLLQDAEPGAEPPEPAPAVPEGFAQVAEVRRALAGDGPLPATLDVSDLAAPRAVRPDLFEALRTALGVAAAHSDLAGSGSLRHPLFARLPAAERLLWAGLATRESDPEDGRRTLHRALALGRDRAALLLSLDAVREGRPGEVHELLDGVRGPKAALVIAWADALDGADTRAAESLAALSTRGLAQADHAAALLALRDAADAWAHADDEGARAHAGRAIERLRAVDVRGLGRSTLAPYERAAEALAAEAEPDWQDVVAQPWTARLLGLARLVRVPESVDASLVRRLSQWLPPRTQGAALAGAALRVALLAEDEEARRSAAALLSRLGTSAADATVERAVRCGAECAGPRHGEAGAEPSGDPLTTLVGAGPALAATGLAEVARQLRAVRPEAGRPAQSALAGALANALEGKTTPPPIGAPANVAAALAVATAAGQASAGDGAAAAHTLLQACLALEMDGLVDLRRALPHLVTSAAKRGRRDATAASLAPTMRQVLADQHDPDGVGGLAVACYHTLLGDFDAADRAWRRLLAHGPATADRLAELRREYGRFLCHQAAAGHLDGDLAGVVRGLRAAVRYLPDTARERLAELEAELLVDTLVTTLLPDSPADDRRWLGRHPRLVELTRANPGLRQALAAGTAKPILQQWRLASLRAGDDAELWHTLAVLAREDALARPPGAPDTAWARTTATALWCVLLTDPAIRARFARLTLPGEADDALRDDLTGALLADRKAQLTEATAQGDRNTAEQSLRCLDAAQQGLPATRRLLECGPFLVVAALQAGDEDAFAPIAERAGKLLDAWGADLVKAARQTLDDSEVISRIDENSKLDKNYEAALDQLEFALRLTHPPTTVLCAALDWGYRWFTCLHDQHDDDSASAVLKIMRPYADRLTPRCAPGRAHTAENKALSEFSYAHGISATRFARKAGGTRRVELFRTAIAHQEQSCVWNPEWDAPSRELCRSRGEELFARGDFAEAERVLRDLGDDNRYTGVLYNNEALVRLRDARALLRIAKTGEHIDTVVDLADEYERMLLQAARLNPDDPVIRDNIREVPTIRAEIAEKRSKLA
ncbi:hypothetical protein [Streptomyces noursei]|uniref:hypothetical protein n=1 Tax=Streptomyces noursei TaxID=1971 RepID=UPI00382FBE84